MSDGQYTLDADPMVLAKRMQTLEHAVDGLTAAMTDLVRTVRVMADLCDKALCEERPVQAKELGECHEHLQETCDRVHAVSVRMGRSY